MIWIAFNKTTILKKTLIQKVPSSKVTFYDLDRIQQNHDPQKTPNTKQFLPQTRPSVVWIEFSKTTILKKRIHYDAETIPASTSPSAILDCIQQKPSPQKTHPL